MSKPDEAGPGGGLPVIKGKKTLRSLASKALAPAPVAMAHAVVANAERVLGYNHNDCPHQAETALLVVGPDRRRAVCFTTRPTCMRKELLREGVYTLGALPPELWHVPAPSDATALSS